jgi:hypothetical protein
MIDERTAWNDAVNELIDRIDTAEMSFVAARDNFNSRRIGRYVTMLDAIADELRGLLDD